MKNLQFLTVLVIVIFLSVGVTSLFYGFYVVQEVKTLDISLEVSDRVGINVASDGLRFGKIPVRGSSQKIFSIKNEYDIPLKVVFKVKGDARELVSISDNYFWIQPGEFRELLAVASAPLGTPLGKYDGKLKVYFKRI